MKNFKNKVIYQIYPKSFQDSNNDGIGDLKGITNRLDYLNKLGVDYIWITPFFKSPQKDNGYDVSDYKSVDKMFGTMEDLEELIQKAKEKDISIMLDMVFNHTSTEHEWFKRALEGDKKYMDYYIFKDNINDKPPTNWVSKFGGNAWEYVPKLDKWYLHLFDKTQADLNWENEEVREELKNVIRFWKEKGIKGFRFDVINLISKPEEFKDDFEGDGRRYYTDGRNVHKFLKELVKDTEIGDMITVGELSSTTLEEAIKYSNPKEKELSMCFGFHHLKVDYIDNNKWKVKKYNFNDLKNIIKEWQEEMQNNDSWNALFWCNHDQPRVVSRFGNDKEYWQVSAKMLATLITLLRGTPYIYQGEELGMTNAYFTDINEYVDVESQNYYKIMLEEGLEKEEALNILSIRSRDNGRTPVLWTEKENVGFSESKPWIKIGNHLPNRSAEYQIQDENSIFKYYKKLIQLRKTNEVISDGNIRFYEQSSDAVFVYERFLGKKRIFVINNLDSTEQIADLPKYLKNCKYIIGNYKQDLEILNDKLKLKPYETIVFESEE